MEAADLEMSDLSRNAHQQLLCTTESGDSRSVTSPGKLARRTLRRDSGGRFEGLGRLREGRVVRRRCVASDGESPLARLGGVAVVGALRTRRSRGGRGVSVLASPFGRLGDLGTENEQGELVVRERKGAKRTAEDPGVKARRRRWQTRGQRHSKRTSRRPSIAKRAKR